MRTGFSIRIIAATLTIGVGALTIAAQMNAPAPTVASTAPVGQTPSPEKSPRRPPSRRPPEPPARVTVVPNQTQLAPQVVTIVHRLTGVKLLRLLQRQSGESFTIENIDPITLMADAHASILAGWALEDGKTVAARLPQAFAEIDIHPPKEARSRTQAANAATKTNPFMLMSPRIEPDLTVITGDGKKFRAHLVGLDGETGLSILQVMGTMPAPPPPRKSDLVAGQGIEIFSPEPFSGEAETLTRTTYVKIGKTDATVVNIAHAVSPAVDKLLVHGGKLSAAVVGGVACDQFGNTLGIVDSIEGNNANIVSASAVQAATKRVLARQASVPRPWLGVTGESIEQVSAAALIARGWQNDQVKELMKDPIGIFLTMVTPQAPAALAKLQAGDVIVSVNQEQIKSADEFSDLLVKAGSGERVEFTVKRPGASAPLQVPVTLGSSFAPSAQWSRFPDVSRSFFGLERWGLQTLGWTAKPWLGFGAENGLIVVAVQPDSAAARSGMREGDVIESIDGHVIARGTSTFTLAVTRQKKHTITIVRAREKKQIVLEVEE
jgi:S1-C subfamily serine protease